MSRWKCRKRVAAKAGLDAVKADIKEGLDAVKADTKEGLADIKEAQADLKNDIKELKADNRKACAPWHYFPSGGFSCFLFFR